MKIAAISEDKINISQHFGRAPLYVVVTVEDGRIISKEVRPKAGHQQFAGEHDPHDNPQERHGYGAASQARHATMAGAISDC
ncbi:MAG: dinitrogenase iron-molybdenum cofactor biosynthesis protein, partial [Chloroflexota bacterium]